MTGASNSSVADGVAPPPSKRFSGSSPLVKAPSRDLRCQPQSLETTTAQVLVKVGALRAISALPMIWYSSDSPS